MDHEYYNLAIVDDEYSIRTNIKQLFPWEELGFNVIGTFPNGLKAFSFIITHEVDVVLTDIRMPIMDGLELTEKLKALGFIMPVVLLSAYDDFAYARKAIEVGAMDYLIKPVSYNEIIKCFENVKFKLQNREYSLCKSDFEKQMHKKLNCFSIEQIASELHCTSLQLKKFIQNEYGKSISELINEIRMKKAKTMLSIPGLHISEISESLGYANPNNFSRAFFLFYGEKPTEWRKSH